MKRMMVKNENDDVLLQLFEMGREREITARAISREMEVRPWRTIGENIRVSKKCDVATPNTLCVATADRERIVDQITSILEYRIDVLIASRLTKNNGASCENRQTCIAGTAAWTELRSFVWRIISMYRNLRYHNAEHAAHVTLSLNKMVDMISRRKKVDAEKGGQCEYFVNEGEMLDFHMSDSLMNYDHEADIISVGHHSACNNESESGYHTFGISSDPLAQLAVVFSALVHDVDHTGVSNRQLILEEDELALLYNDQSMAEQHSLKVAFSILFSAGYDELRKAMIPTADDKFRFRKIVIDMVMCTDISSPERVQIGENKWNRAFEGANDSVSPMGHKNSSETEKNFKNNNKSSSFQRPSQVCRSNKFYGRRHSVDCGSATNMSPLSHHFSHRPQMYLNGATIEFYPKDSTNVERKLRANAVLEQMMQAADIAHTMQSWETFIKWNSRLYAELHDAFINGRGDDPSQSWYAGQIAFYDSCVLPLAKRLGDCGAFGEDIENDAHDIQLEGGNIFFRSAQENRRRWELEGRAMSDALARLVNEQDDFNGLTPETIRLFSEKNLSTFALSSKKKEDRDIMIKNIGCRKQERSAPVQYGARSA